MLASEWIDREVAADWPDPQALQDRLAGALLGTAIGDAMGLPMEGMPASAVARRFPRIDRYSLVGETGFVSDDTEQSALVAQSLIRHPRDMHRFVRAFRGSLLGWFMRLPWGIGLGTLKACVRIALGFRRSGVASAGNGAAMRSAILGVYYFDAPTTRREWADALARVTHTDPRAVQGARYVAELAARCTTGWAESDRGALVERGLLVVAEPALLLVLERSRRLANDRATVDLASNELGCSGFVLHTLAIATFCFLRFGDDPERAIVETIRAGGDTDSNAAIVGAWVGALHGEAGLPPRLIAKLHDRDWFSSRARGRKASFAGPTHLRALAVDLSSARDGHPRAGTTYSWVGALLRNVALYPVVLTHAFRVIFQR